MTQRQNITAIIYNRRGQILSMGKNSYIKTHPLQKSTALSLGIEHKEHIHAEVAALVKLKDWSKAYRIVVTRIMKDGSFGSAKPCPVCEKLIHQAGIKIVEHT